MGEMTAGRFPLFCLIICFLVRSSDAQTNITTETISVDLGQDVILPCKVPNNYNINNNIAVEWNRPDQDPEYVLYYHDGRIDPNNQHPSYQNRVDLQDKEMKDGNFSLILKNVTMEDRGTYICRVFEKGKNEPISSTYLKIRVSAQKMTGVEKITADVGQNVTLPCKDPKNNKTITAVEWIRPDLEPEYVLFYKHGRKDPNNQHESYQNRVDLQDKDMKDGNVSLILKNVTKNDTGTYMCWVFQKGKNDLINIINLEVHDDTCKTIIGVVVVIIPLILALGFVVYKKLQNRKRKILFNALQEVIQRLERNNPEINNQLQQEEQENENLEDEQEELMGNNPEINNQLQQEEQENENLEDEQIELDEMNSDTNSDPTGCDEKNQQEEGVPLAAGVHE